MFKEDGTIEERIEDILNYYLEEMSFEEFLELFNLTPHEVFTCAFDTGLIDEEDLDNIENL